MEYLTVIGYTNRKMNVVKLLLPDGRIIKKVASVLKVWKQVPLYGDKYISGKPLRLIGPAKAFENPQNITDRVYLYKLKKTARYTTVVRPDNTALDVPNEYMDSWYAWSELVDKEMTSLYISAQMMDKLQLSDLTFGVEFEFTAPISRGSAFNEAMKNLVGKNRFCKHRYNDEDFCMDDDEDENVKEDDTKQWILKTDSSIESPKGYESIELTSPVLHISPDCAAELRAVLDCIKNVYQGKVNNSCGTHIHIGNFVSLSLDRWGRFASEHRHQIGSWLEGFVKCYAKFEKSVFDKFVSYDRRRSRNEYCQACKDWDGDRYFKINLQCLRDNGTFENRQHHGTLDFTDIWSWIILNGLFFLTWIKEPSVLNEPMDFNALADRIHLPLEIRNYYIDCAETIQRRDEAAIEAQFKKKLAGDFAASLPEEVSVCILPAFQACA